MAVRFDLGPLALLVAQSFGEPGNRTFRLVASDGHQAIAVWLEKEQLKALADAIDELLMRMRGGADAPDPGHGIGEAPPLPPPTTIPEPDHELNIEQLSLGFDRELDLFVVFAWEAGESGEENATLVGRVNREQLRTLSQSIGEIYVAGRPRCLLCGLPIEAGEHQCLRRNGHYQAPTDQTT